MRFSSSSSGERAEIEAHTITPWRPTRERRRSHATRGTSALRREWSRHADGWQPRARAEPPKISCRCLRLYRQAAQAAAMPMPPRGVTLRVSETRRALRAPSAFSSRPRFLLPRMIAAYFVFFSQMPSISQRY